MRAPSLTSLRPPPLNVPRSTLHDERSTRAAFTLLEIMIVVGVAALVMTISVPFVTRTLRQDAAFTATQAFLNGCHNARSIAILNNAPADLVIRPLEREVFVEPRAAPVAEAAFDPLAADASPPRPARKDVPKALRAQLDESVLIILLGVNFQELQDADEARVRFQPNGTSDEFAVVFQVGTQRRKIQLDPVTGTPEWEVIQ